jgi:hypothetical protein
MNQKKFKKWVKMWAEDYPMTKVFYSTIEHRANYFSFDGDPVNYHLSGNKPLLEVVKAYRKRCKQVAKDCHCTCSCYNDKTGGLK